MRDTRCGRACEESGVPGTSPVVAGSVSGTVVGRLQDVAPARPGHTPGCWWGHQAGCRWHNLA
jgi:hypothetical protein